MAEATEVTRTQRVEFVDDEGRMRAVLGRIGTGDEAIYGLVVPDEHGRERAWIVHDGRAVEIGLDFDGDTVAAVTVAETGEPAGFLVD